MHLSEEKKNEVMKEIMIPLEKRLTRLKQKDVEINSVLDIGAYHGDFVKLIKHIYPKATSLMIECNEQKEERLKKVGDYKIALLGKQDDEIVDYYHCLEEFQTGNGIYKENSPFKFTVEKRKTITLSTLLGSDKGYDFIKMDVQGAELDIIKGGLPIIKNSKYLLLEMQLLMFNKGAPRIEEVISYLHSIGFKFIDIFDFIYEGSQDLIQIDGLFINGNIE
tara:strand:+ start:197 stop:859 length:663 start_codon:yes stop_codon:yes gene_type:complete